MNTLRKVLLMCALAFAPSALGCASDDGDDESTEPNTPGNTAGSAAEPMFPPSGAPVAGSSAAPMAGSAAMPMAGSASMPMAGSAAMPPEAKDIVDTAVAAGTFSKLADALTKAGLVDALRGEGPFTVFAPTDAAFEAFEAKNPGVLAGLGVDALANILKYHVISGAAVKSTELRNGQLAATLAGPVLAVDLADGVMINDASVTTADIVTKNGVIHVIDKIIVPPGDIIEVATAAGSFSKLAAALTSANLVDTLKGDGPFTVFAPTDDAFAAFETANPGVIASLGPEALANVLTYHVLSGIAGALDLVDGGAAATVSGSPILFDLSNGAKIEAGEGTSAKISVTNVVASNGVIHVIDAVIVPPSKDIVETAVAAGTFNTLASALTAQGLVDTLKGKGPFTVFAPTDAAFSMLSAVPSGDALKKVLLYHVTDDLIGSGNLAGAGFKMLSGDSVTVDLAGGVKIDESNVASANILAKNGIIHVIDKVLVP